VQDLSKEASMPKSSIRPSVSRTPTCDREIATDRYRETDGRTDRHRAMYPRVNNVARIMKMNFLNIHREAEKRNHFSFMHKSFNTQRSLTKFSTLIFNEYYHRCYLSNFLNLH